MELLAATRPVSDISSAPPSHNSPINMQRRDYKKTTPLIPTFYTRRKYVPDNILAADRCIVNILPGTDASLNKSLLKILNSFI